LRSLMSNQMATQLFAHNCVIWKRLETSENATEQELACKLCKFLQPVNFQHSLHLPVNPSLTDAVSVVLGVWNAVNFSLRSKLQIRHQDERGRPVCSTHWCVQICSLAVMTEWSSGKLSMGSISIPDNQPSKVIV
jgi:hypothetical protein